MKKYEIDSVEFQQLLNMANDTSVKEALKTYQNARESIWKANRALSDARCDAETAVTTLRTILNKR